MTVLDPYWVDALVVDELVSDLSQPSCEPRRHSKKGVRSKLLLERADESALLELSSRGEGVGATPGDGARGASGKVPDRKCCAAARSAFLDEAWMGSLEGPIAGQKPPASPLTPAPPRLQAPSLPNGRW